MSESSILGRIQANRWVTFMVLMFVLAVGITIGTLVSTPVDAERTNAEQLKISAPAKPLDLDAQAGQLPGFAAVASKVSPAVVYVDTETEIRTRVRSPHGQLSPEDFFPFDFRNIPEVQRVRSVGSGFLVDSQGYIITNAHVVAQAKKIKVNLQDGREFSARVIGMDEWSDVAVIKIDGDKPFPSARIGDSSAMRTGDWVVAIGSPFNLSQTVTAGIISATGRVFPQQGRFNDYLQTDASINRGNSGGPLVNLAGEVVGINTFIQSTSGSSAGVGFAVPSQTFVGIYNQLIRDGKVHRGWLGISMNSAPMTPEMARFFGLKSPRGVIVTELVDEKGNPSREGPAGRAGLQVEDVIVEIDGKVIENEHDLRTIIAGTTPGRKVKIKAIRKGTEKLFEVALAERTIETQGSDRSITLDEEAEEPPKPQEIGLTVDNLTSGMARQLRMESTEGALAVEVKGGSLAEEAGLARNDLILQFNGKDVANAQSFGQQFRALKSGEGAVLKCMRLGADGQKRIFYTSLVKP